ncbi:MAG TPA: dihydrolipoamide acetyltransferase family protein [Solirubrobacteraceae bacterium]
MPVEIVMPRLSDSMEEGTILQWFVSEGDAVVAGEPLVEVETDKASVTYESEHDGTVLKLGAQVGDSVAVGAVIVTVGAAGETMGAVPALAAAAGAPAAAGAGAAAGAPTAAGGTAAPADAPTPRGDERVKASPLARRIAAELGVELATLAGSGPQGRVIRADVERAARGAASGRNGGSAPAGPSLAPAGAPVPSGAVPAETAKGETTRESLSRLQQTIARRMAESRATVPDFELRVEIDMARVVALREQMRVVTDRPPSYNDFIVKAAALALRAFPRVNGAYRDGGFEHYGRVNVGIAVAADDALVVPTIFDADRRSLGEIGAAARELAAKVRDGSITPAELAGSTFSISNLGMYGTDSFSAVINPPQAAILAVGSLKLRPVVDESDPGAPAIVARPTIHVTLACDHRILYGADGARFLARVRELLEAPVALLL